ncbi:MULTISPECIES: Lrp/AsnC ligand binding domain-containing protein [unclassified Aureimonas]|uniref:Lrp/AsnC ligand binding domain-containing protein n=1 Tax=unclassified Aureimonas TaxID=2615206 RepID=UPI0006FE5D8D|nr:MULTISPECIES: Lrp/AsnC ligand binding domain-containing protein [unclassified Aureimonas]KQT64188.1 ArsR family transcriptional regulator [Aureimonas sp. Leaf427]KQT81377.1 ArsR family transcriptional regulator [Aureimonas sp. Leaf460]
MSEIDDKDRQILRQLQTDGRLSNLDLATRVHLSPTATAERVKRLQRDGYILGFSARLSPEKLGRGLIVFVEVKLERTSEDVFGAFAKAAKANPDIMECHMVAGGFDYLLKARVADMNAYRAFLSDALLNLPGIRETHTYAVMEEIKNTAAISL